MSKSTVIFIFKGIKTILHCFTAENLIDICKRFSTIINENLSKLNFIYNNEIINKELKFEELIDEKDKKSKIMNIIVEEIKSENNEKQIKDENNNNKLNDNFILAEIYIEKYDINKEIRIINSYEQYKREFNLKDEENDNEYENEKEIKEKCMIKINNKIIEFNYFYNFEEEGKYEIKYIFKENVIKADYMFYGCNSLLKIDLSNFNSQKNY